MSRIPTSGVLTWNDIQNSFGGSNPIGINEYYTGSSLAPFSPLNLNIPTSGQIEAADFRGSDGFSGTTGTFSCGNSGGKLPSGGFDYPSYGSDLGMAFTTGGGVKTTIHAVSGLGGIVGLSCCTASPNTLNQLSAGANQITSSTVTMSGAHSFSGTISNPASSANTTTPPDYNGGTAQNNSVRLAFYNTTMPSSGTVNISIS
jgi:hypothetical protein